MHAIIIGVLAYLLLNNKKIVDRIALTIMLFSILIVFLFPTDQANVIISTILIILFPSYFLYKVLEEDDNDKLTK